MSVTEEKSGDFLTVNKRAIKFRLTWAKLKILLAISKHRGAVKRRVLEEAMGVSLNMEHVAELKKKGFLCYERIEDDRTPYNLYSLTHVGGRALSVILTGKEPS